MNIDKQREAFEAWAVVRWTGVNLSPDQSNCGIVVYERYKHPKLQAAWEAWQARAALSTQSSGNSGQLNLEAAARTLAENMDYPWEHMPPQGREAMLLNAKRVIDAALSEQEQKK